MYVTVLSTPYYMILQPFFRSCREQITMFPNNFTKHNFTRWTGGLELSHNSVVRENPPCILFLLFLFHCLFACDLSCKNSGIFSYRWWYLWLWTVIYSLSPREASINQHVWITKPYREYIMYNTYLHVHVCMIIEVNARKLGSVDKLKVEVL